MTDKEKLKEILKWCKINAKGWDPDQHDGPAEFKAICDLIEEKGYYKKNDSPEKSWRRTGKTKYAAGGSSGGYVLSG